MEKPEDIAEWAWDRALRVEGGHHPGIVEACARAIHKAREEAFEEAAKIAEQARWISRPGADEKSAETLRRITTDWGTKIASAIRQHSQKGDK